MMQKARTRIRRRGAAAILAMMFLVIFASLATAMAIVAQGNLATADSHLKINRSLATAETAMNLIVHRLNIAADAVQTRDGDITHENAPDLWLAARDELAAMYADDLEVFYDSSIAPQKVGNALIVGPLPVGPDSPTYVATLEPHPLAGENYDSDYYQRAPYNQLTPPVSSTYPLDSTWVRVTIEATDGQGSGAITRSLQMDFQIDKKIPFAILSRNRVMIGRNVMIDGPIGSGYIETFLPFGHPVQIQSDFEGLDASLDSQIEAFYNTVNVRDADGDNRLNLLSAAEVDGIDSPEQYDTNGDNYIDDYDFFLAHYDSNGDGAVNAMELDTDNNINTAQLLELIDTFGDPTRDGYNDGVIDELDDYAKIHGQIRLKTDWSSWYYGSAGNAISDYYRGPVSPDYGSDPLTYQANDFAKYQFEPSDFNTASFSALADGDLASQAANQAAAHDPEDPASPKPLGTTELEPVPYESAHPYDFYDRPVYENMTFRDVKIPKGTNAVFKNCKFIGVTFVETETGNTAEHFNYAGMQDAQGESSNDIAVMVNGDVVSDTKTISNNVRFDDCTFEGAVVADAPEGFSHVRNKLTFTGNTRFQIDDSENLSDSEKALYKRSTLLAPHFSVEMGSFASPADPGETLELSGTIVAGVADFRGQVKINGTLMTTFEPRSFQAPVIGEGSPHFNTTLGYFSSDQGDLEAELPAGGRGLIHVTYDPTLALPDGILGPIQITPVTATYFEGTAVSAY